MFPYIFATVTLVIYWFLHAKNIGGIKDWLTNNPKTALVQVAVMFAVVFFRNILTPYLALPIVLGATTALLTGTLVDKLAKLWEWIKDTAKGLFSAPDAEK